MRRSSKIFRKRISGKTMERKVRNKNRRTIEKTRKNFDLIWLKFEKEEGLPRTPIGMSFLT